MVTAGHRASVLQVGGIAAAFVGLGMSGAIPPALLPVLGRELGAPAQQMSLVLSALFAGLCVGVVLTAAIGEALAPARAVAAGAVVQGAGLVLLAAATVPLAALSGGFVLGVGFGATELSAFAVARRTEVAPGPLLSHLTAALAVTSAVTPVVVGLLASTGYWRAALVGAAAVHAVTAVAVLLAVPGSTPRPAATAWRSALRVRRAHVLVFGYVGAEVLVGAWTARLAASALGLQPAAAAAATAAFWASLAVGRVAAGLLLRGRLTAERLLAPVLVSASAWFLLAAALSGVPRALAVVLGLMSAGPAYGLIVATTDGAGDRRVLGGLIATGALGGAVVSALGAAAFAVAGLEGVLLLAAASLAGAVLAHRRPAGARSGRRMRVEGGVL
jgi:fucose permease